MPAGVDHMTDITRARMHHHLNPPAMRTPHLCIDTEPNPNWAQAHMDPTVYMNNKTRCHTPAPVVPHTRWSRLCDTHHLSPNAPPIVQEKQPHRLLLGACWGPRGPRV
ncbi:hypothetical protein BS47DRAFT_1364072 [Hydnum rufescens UP504]|uniref:Uncharacterized protein n=1 Tax=Hydnum rufescens UP504 TaxID=1448309 RepID=A0A9P6ASG3_9AGAM|nr:hypothetical protein BS47DRAFT_1364072 [Hydnum rufescens UP504]